MLYASSSSLPEQHRLRAVQVREPCPPTSPTMTSSALERRPPLMPAPTSTPTIAMPTRVCGLSAIKHRTWLITQEWKTFILNRYFFNRGNDTENLCVVEGLFVKIKSINHIKYQLVRWFLLSAWFVRVIKDIFLQFWNLREIF